MEKTYYVYVLTNYKNTVIYIGVTNDLLKRVFQHKNKVIAGFTSKYNVNKLVYFEEFEDVDFALQLEKQLKNWKRYWKFDLISQEKKPSFI